MLKLVSLVLFVTMFLPHSACGIENSDFHFLFGYQAFLTKDFPTCVSELELAMKFTEKKRVYNKAALFKSICLVKQGERTKSAYQAVRIRTRYLPSWDKRHFVRLKNYLNEDYDKALKERDTPPKPIHPLAYSVALYGGTIGYQEPSQKEKVGMQGIFGSINHRSYIFNVGFETNTLKGRTYSGFTQTQGHLALQKTWGEWSLVGRYTNISSNHDSQDGIQVYGLGVGWRVFERTKLFADGFYSHYPSSDLGTLTVLQTHFALEHVIYKTSSIVLWGKVGLQQTNASSSLISRGESFIKEGYANRSYLDLGLRIKSFTLTGGFWAGQEVFGVRNNGLLVFTTPEEHLGGQNLGLSWLVNKKYSLGINWMNESIRIETVESSAQTTLGTFTYYFY